MTERITSLETLRARRREWQGQRVALVPTMGALHHGHAALVDAARAVADKVVASIFVNPTQFGPGEDLGRYPRTLDNDMALLRVHGADAAWVPDVAAMYPEGFQSRVEVAGVSEGLCGASRPGHFSGVATVVAKLLGQVGPDVAVFGEKDYQQLCVVRQMVRDLDMDITIQGVPTVREADGLAMSSRNRYFTPEERAIAPELYRGLRYLAARKDMNEHLFKEQKDVWLKNGFSQVEYLELREADTLKPLDAYKPGARLLVAARLGTTRLIDNCEV